MFAAILSAVISIVGSLPQLISGIEAAFGKKSGQGSQKWISIETALSPVITNFASEIAATVPNAKVDSVAAEIAKFTKATNDAIVAFYNSVGWPVGTPATTAPVVPPTS